MNKQELDKKLRELGDEKYKAFHSKLKPSESEVIAIGFSTAWSTSPKPPRTGWQIPTPTRKKLQPGKI